VIVFLDTSALLKLFVAEANSALVREIVSQSAVVVACVLTYVEARSALTRKRRGGELTQEEHARAVSTFESQWPSYAVVELPFSLVRAAAVVAERHALRGYDAVQLASAIEFQAQYGERVTFVSADQRLCAAAAAEGLDAA